VNATVPATKISRDETSRRARAVWFSITIVALTLLLAIIAAPLASAFGYTSFASSIYKAFSFVCHQIPERSFHLAGNKFAVCSRCTGLYSGFAAAVLAYPVARSLRNTATPSILWLILAALPLAIDFSLGYFNIWANTQASRFATAALFSATTVFYIVPGLIEIAGMLLKRQSAKVAGVG
jgi:uncharacterized membrane protein